MDIFKLIVIFFFSLYNLVLYLNGDISNYISQRFFTASFIASIAGVSISFIGIVYFYIKESNKKDILSNITPLITLGTLLIIGILINPVFLLISIPVFVYLRKNIKFKFDLGILIILVVILGLAIPSTSLTSVTASQRAGDLNSVTLDSRLSTISRFSSSANYDIGDWIASINYNPDLKFYEGKEVNVVGFVFLPENYPEDVFYVARFVVTCCAVDARPVGLNVKLADWNNQISIDEWVEVKGKFAIENVNGFDQLIIIPDSVSETEEPDRPYIY